MEDAFFNLTRQKTLEKAWHKVKSDAETSRSRDTRRELNDFAAKGYSAILSIVPNPEKRARIPDLKYFHSFVRAMFFHRRKFLRSNLLSTFKGQLSKPQVDGIMVGQQIEGNARSEQLDVNAMLDLAVAVAAELGD